MVEEEATKPELTEEEKAAEKLDGDAEFWKKQGNDKLTLQTKEGNLEARDAYTKGIKIGCPSNKLNSQLLSNRAHVRILLKEYVEAIDDCRAAIKFDPKNIKAWWRGARASVAIDLWKQASEFIEDGLQVDLNNAELLRLRKQVQIELKKIAQRNKTDGANFDMNELSEAQEKLNEVQEQHAMLEAQIMAAKRETMRSQGTIKFLDELGPETPAFKPVGRCFIQQTHSDLKKALTATAEKHTAELPKMVEASKSVGEKKAECERNVTEMVNAFNRNAQQTMGAK